MLPFSIIEVGVGVSDVVTMVVLTTESSLGSSVISVELQGKKIIIFGSRTPCIFHQIALVYGGYVLIIANSYIFYQTKYM